MMRIPVAFALASLLAGGAGVGTAGVPGDIPAMSPIEPSLVLVSSLDAREELVADSGDVAVSVDGTHDPSKMLLLSLAVPGAGQIVQGNKRGYLFLLAEIAFWGSFYALDGKGLDERDEYERFADENWDYQAYQAWYAENCCEECPQPDDEYECRPVAEYGSQEYYEDIGKYDTYWRWWNIDGDEDDILWDEYSNLDEAVRGEYWAMRGDSNEHLRHARYFLMAALLNHVVAALDSFLTARTGPERELSERDLGLEFDVADGGEGLDCALVARY